MSLSGQYLEELSRRYKTQVEELQTAFSKTLIVVEEQNRRNLERESFYFERIAKLQENLDELNETFSLPNIIFYIMIIASCQLFIMYLIIRMWMRRFYRQAAQNRLPTAATTATSIKCNDGKNRRKSMDGSSTGGGGNITGTHRNRRPSDDASDHIGSYKELLIDDDDDDNETDIYNVNGTVDQFEADELTSKKRNGKSRKQIVRAVSLEPIRSDSKTSVVGPSSSDYEKLKKRYIAMSDSSKPMLDDEYEVYMPGTDLMYNEFMPGGPSGGPNGDTSTSSLNSKAATPPAKSRRVSSPAFLKTPFYSSGGGGGGGGVSGSKSESKTGWQWYRLKKGGSGGGVNGDGAAAQSSQMKTKKKSKASAPPPPPPPIKSNGKGINNGMMSTPPPPTTERNSNDSGSTSTTTVSSSTTTSGSSKKQGSFRKILRKVF